MVILRQLCAFLLLLTLLVPATSHGVPPFKTYEWLKVMVIKNKRYEIKFEIEVSDQADFQDSIKVYSRPEGQSGWWKVVSEYTEVNLTNFAFTTDLKPAEKLRKGVRSHASTASERTVWPRVRYKDRAGHFGAPTEEYITMKVKAQFTVPDATIRPALLQAGSSDPAQISEGESLKEFLGRLKLIYGSQESLSPDARRNLGPQMERALTDFLSKRDYASKPVLFGNDVEALLEEAENSLARLTSDVNKVIGGNTPNISKTVIPEYLGPDRLMLVLRRDVLKKMKLASYKLLPGEIQNRVYSLLQERTNVINARAHDLDVLARDFSFPWTEGSLEKSVDTSSLYQKSIASIILNLNADHVVQARNGGARLRKVVPDKYAVTSYDSMIETFKKLSSSPRTSRFSDAFNATIMTIFQQQNAEEKLIVTNPDLISALIKSPFEEVEGMGTLILSKDIENLSPDFSEWLVVQMDRLIKNQPERVVEVFKEYGIELDLKNYNLVLPGIFRENTGPAALIPEFELNEKSLKAFQTSVSRPGEHIGNVIKDLASLDLLRLVKDPAKFKTLLFELTAKGDKLPAYLEFLWKTGGSLTRVQLLQSVWQVYDNVTSVHSVQSDFAKSFIMRMNESSATRGQEFRNFAESFASTEQQVMGEHLLRAMNSFFRNGDSNITQTLFCDRSMHHVLEN